MFAAVSIEVAATTSTTGVLSWSKIGARAGEMWFIASMMLRASTTARELSAPATSATPPLPPSGRNRRVPAMRAGRSPVGTVAGKSRIGAGTN